MTHGAPFFEWSNDPNVSELAELFGENPDTLGVNTIVIRN
jgi:hypothetical protein